MTALAAAIALDAFGGSGTILIAAQTGGRWLNKSLVTPPAPAATAGAAV